MDKGINEVRNTLAPYKIMANSYLAIQSVILYGHLCISVIPMTISSDQMECRRQAG